jgi:hypothetical protein
MISLVLTSLLQRGLSALQTIAKLKLTKESCIHDGIHTAYTITQPDGISLTMKVA